MQVIRRPVETLAVKTCTCCKRTMPLNNFCRDKYSKDGLRYTCRVCGTAKSKERREVFVGNAQRSL